MTLKQIKFKITHLDYLIGYYLNFDGYKGSGLDLKKPDKRNYKHDDMFVGGWSGYEPQSEIKILPGISDAWNQGSTLCCQWFATAKAKEIYEGVRLSVKSLISWGRRNGLTGDKGLSAMESGEKGLKNWGIMEESDMPSVGDYDDLSTGNVTTVEASIKADKHKSSAYIQLNSVDGIYKMIDAGRPVKIGIPWYSGFNRSSKREEYWLIDGVYGYYNGGHSIYLPGYALKLFKEDGCFYQNSYGKDWGKIFTDNDGNSVNGAGFITRKQLERLGKKYGFFVNFDVETNLDLTAEQILERFDGQNVRGNKKGAIARIIGGGYKAEYLDDKAFLSYNGFPYTKPGAFIIVKQEELDKIPFYGDGILNGDGGKFKEMVDILKDPVNGNFKV